MDVACVSTDGQTFDAQVAAFKAAGAEKGYSEKQSGARCGSFPLGVAQHRANQGTKVDLVFFSLESELQISVNPHKYCM